MKDRLKRDSHIDLLSLLSAHPRVIQTEFSGNEEALQAR